MLFFSVSLGLGTNTTLLGLGKDMRWLRIPGFVARNTAGSVRTSCQKCLAVFVRPQLQMCQRLELRIICFGATNRSGTFLMSFLLPEKQLKVAQHLVKTIRFCHPDPRQKCLDVFLKTCSFVARDMAVKMSHLLKSIQFSRHNPSWKMFWCCIKYPVLLQQQWLENNLKSLLKYLVFFRHDYGCECPDITSKCSVFSCSIHKKKCLDVSLKTLGFVATNMDGKCPGVSLETVVLHSETLKSSPRSVDGLDTTPQPNVSMVNMVCRNLNCQQDDLASL